MKSSVKKQWVERLRSGQYEQGRNSLRTIDNKYCCLGVLCELAVEAGVIPKPGISRHDYNYNGYIAQIPPPVMKWAGLSDTLGMPPRYSTVVVGGKKHSSLADANDRGQPFDQIADAIERVY